MIPSRYDQLRHWLMHQFPECHDVEVTVMNDATSLLPPGAPPLPYVSGEPAVLFRVVEETRAPPWKELAIAKPALTDIDPDDLRRVLEREQVAEQLRVSPEHRLFVDRQLKVERLGTTWEAGGPPGTPVGGA